MTEKENCEHKWDSPETRGRSDQEWQCKKCWAVCSSFGTICICGNHPNKTQNVKPIARKPIKISWVAPNGKPYEDTINMSLHEYEDFVNGLLDMKKCNNK